MPTPDERTITLSVAEWNIVLNALQLANAIGAKIAAQAAEQERALALANGQDIERQNAPNQQA